MDKWFVAIVACLFLVAGCNKDNGDDNNTCTITTCQNDGTLATYGDGTCECNCTGTFTGTECETNLCAGFTCDHGTLSYTNGACNCACETGYIGAHCDQTIAEPWLGTYAFNASCSRTVTQQDTLTISAGSTPAGVIVSGFGSFQQPAVIHTEVTSTGIQFNAYVASNGATYTGSIGYTSGSYNFSYTETSSSFAPDYCNGTMIKQ